MTWKFLYVDGLKARLALLHMSFIEEYWWRLIWYNQRPSGLHVISHKATVPMVDMANHFKFSIICKENEFFPFLLSNHLFYTWLITPCRRWGSNEVQQCNKTYITWDLTTEKQPDTVMGLFPCTQIDKMQTKKCRYYRSFTTMGLQAYYLGLN